MSKLILIAILPILGLFGYGTDTPQEGKQKPDGASTGVLEKMIVAHGTVSMELDMGRLTGRSARSGSVQFEAEPNSFLPILVFNNDLRAPLPGTINLTATKGSAFRETLGTSHKDLAVERMPWESDIEWVVRDAKTGFVLFNIEGAEDVYDANERTFALQGGRLMLTKGFADELGRSANAGTMVGELSLTATMRTIEVSNVVNGVTESAVLPAANPEAGTVPGPDVVVGDVSGLTQVSTQSGSQVGLAIATDSCNYGVVPLNWFAMPQVDHPVIPQNLYRLSGGANNNERFEQVGQSSLKHAFTALQNNLCMLTCSATASTTLGSGCSDPYSVSNNSNQGSLGSRAWVNPFTGAFPSTANSHVGHTHAGPSHRILTEVSDLTPAQNPGATYFAEGQYVTPHEYAWCQSHPGECNMYNNVSYRQYNVSSAGAPFSFTAVSTTVRQKAAISAWPGSTQVEIKPDPGNDGVAVLAYKVTNTSPGVWHYEYAIYNQNLDRSIRSFIVPVGNSTLSNLGFHAPPQHPAWANDGTSGSAGYSSAAWAQTSASGYYTWNAETLAQNPNSNAIRWGTLYNFRFDSNRPPALANAVVGFLKTGAPITVQIQVPSAPTVTISGYVRTSEGRGITGAVVSMQDAMGQSRTATTNRVGFYRFDNVPGGFMFTIMPTSRRYDFTSRQLTFTDNVTDLNFTPN